MQTHESIKKAAAFLLAVVLLFSAVPVTVHAADKEQEKENGYKNASAEVLPEQITVENRITFTGQISPHEELPDNGELFSWFVERELYGYDMALFGIAGRNSLNAEEQAVYDVLKQNIENVALAGGSTVFTLSDIPGLKMTWTNEELNVSSIDDYNLVGDAFYGQIDLDALHKALLSDCPFDLYWYDKTVEGAIRMSISMTRSGYRNGSSVVWNEATVTSVTFTFTVAKDYKAAENVVTSNVAKVSTARTNAAKVVSDNNGKSAYEKLVAYKEYICREVTYDDAAANENYSGGYGDPWQLISVFDGDSTTSVVCEGYSKAFQYLCELGGLNCISASGTMSANGKSGPHMWNVVTLYDRNYLVDVTNCDEGTIGAPDLLFLTGANYASGGYTIRKVRYTCENLDLSAVNYTRPVAAQAVLGDFDLDGSVDAHDLTVLARHVAGIEQQNNATGIGNADVNGDGALDAEDLTKHARYVSEIISSWDQA